MKRSIRMQENDDVATLLADAEKDDIIGVYDEQNQFLYEIKAEERIPFGNKIALHDIPGGKHVIKYSGIIGESTMDIPKGTLVHVHNVKSLKVDIPPAFKIEIMRQMGIKKED